MGVAQAAALVPLDPERAHELWVDVRRWPTFVEGFSHVVEERGDWPAEGAVVVWQSGPGGRGRVTEKVVESSGSALATRVFEEALQGTQRATFTSEEEGTRVDLRLEYELNQRGPLRAVADLLFIRRALRDALRRTLRRYATEAGEEAV